MQQSQLQGVFNAATICDFLSENIPANCLLSSSENVKMECKVQTEKSLDVKLHIETC